MLNDEKPKPDIYEIFCGRDVSLGKEIVEKLASEGIAVAVYRVDYGDKKN